MFIADEHDDSVDSSSGSQLLFTDFWWVNIYLTVNSSVIIVIKLEMCYSSCLATSSVVNIYVSLLCPADYSGIFKVCG